MNTFNINKFLLGVVVLLLILVGFQTYLLFQKSDEPDTGRGMIQFEQKDLFSPDTSIQDWDPFDDFQRMQKRMDQFFSKEFPQIGNGFPNLKSFSFGGDFSQNLNLEDKDGKYVVTLEIPGLDQTNVDVNIEGQSLKVSGDMERRNETDKNSGFVKSFQSQHFERYLTLPGPIKPETLMVDYKKTKLIITVEKIAPR